MEGKNRVFIERAKRTIKEKLSVDDVIKRLIGIIDESEKSINTLFEPLYDLFLFYYPEAASMLKSRDVFLSHVRAGLSRDILSANLGIQSASMGIDMDKRELDLIKDGVDRLSSLMDLRENVNVELSRLITGAHPNIARIAGPQVAGRLIALAGSINDLSRMPASKIQVLGAEKALFSAKGKTPKYGVIYKNPLLESAPRGAKGKIARILASKISIASRIDAFSKRDDSVTLYSEMENDIKRVTVHESYKSK